MADSNSKLVSLSPFHCRCLTLHAFTLVDMTICSLTGSNISIPTSRLGRRLGAYRLSVPCWGRLCNPCHCNDNFDTSALMDVTHDPTYYLSDGNTVFQVQSTLFNVHQSALTRDGSTFQDMFLLGVDSHRELKESGNLKAVPDGEGVCDKHPIHLQGDTVDEFRALLWSFYALPSDIFDATRPENIDTIKFMNLARVTHKYNFISTEKWALEILTLYLTSVSQQPIPSELDGPSFEPLSPEILENLTKVAVLCTSEDQPLFKKTMAGWELLLGHGDYAETAIRVAELLGLRHLRASAYYAIMIKGRQAWDLKPNLSREQRITLLSGHHALFELSRGLLGSPPQFHNCYGAQTCRRSLASCWGNLFAGGISDSDTIPAASSLHPLDLLGRLQLLEGQFVKISEYAATALNGMTRPCALEGLKAIRALQEKLRLDLSDCFQDVA